MYQYFQQGQAPGREINSGGLRGDQRTENPSSDRLALAV